MCSLTTHHYHGHNEGRKYSVLCKLVCDHYWFLMSYMPQVNYCYSVCLQLLCAY